MNEAAATMQRPTREILAPFGLVPSNNGNVFESLLIEAAGKIRRTYRFLSYDHRPEAPEWDRKFDYLMCEQFRVGYACFKFAVASVLQPKTICEIGVGAGTGARAFLAAAPNAHYIGMDDGSKDLGDNVHLIDYTRELMAKKGYSHEFLMGDSMAMGSAPKADLFHVDGAHDFAHAFNDTKLAVDSGSPWILVDDTRDLEVCAGAMMAVHGSRVVCEWTHFEDTWTGSILFHRRNG